MHQSMYSIVLPYLSYKNTNFIKLASHIQKIQLFCYFLTIFSNIHDKLFSMIKKFLTLPADGKTVSTQEGKSPSVKEHKK